MTPRADHRGPRFRLRQDDGDAGAAGGAYRRGLQSGRPRSAPTISIPRSITPQPAGQASISTAGPCRLPCSTRWWARLRADLLMIEGAMGLFDGITARPGRTGASADLAARFSLPVVLVLDVAGQSQSAAAVLRGFAGHDPAVNIAGVVLNRRWQRAPSFDWWPKRSRRLAFRSSVRFHATSACFARASSRPGAGRRAWRSRSSGSIASPISPSASSTSMASDAWQRRLACPGRDRCRPDPPGSRIALAQDEAFSFVYPHLFAAWRQAGAEIVPFSPLADEAPPATLRRCWLPGGYPELMPAARRRGRFPLGVGAFAATAGPRRVRRLHGAGRDAGGC